MKSRHPFGIAEGVAKAAKLSQGNGSAIRGCPDPCATMEKFPLAASGIGEASHQWLFTFCTPVGLVSAIHVRVRGKDMDGRHNAGQDGVNQYDRYVHHPYAPVSSGELREHYKGRGRAMSGCVMFL